MKNHKIYGANLHFPFQAFEVLFLLFTAGNSVTVAAPEAVKPPSKTQSRKGKGRERERGENLIMLEVKSLKKALVPKSLIPNPSPGNLQSTRLAIHVKEDASPPSCWVYIASGCRIYKVLVWLDGSFVNQGKESLLIPQESSTLQYLIAAPTGLRSRV